MNGYGRKLLPLAIISIVGVVSYVISNSRPAVAQNPVPGSAPVNLVSPLPLPVTGSVDVTGPISVQQSGAWTVKAEPEKPSKLVTLVTSKRPGIRCPEDGFAGRVSYPLDGIAVQGGGGVFNIFSIPQGQVLVITRFDWQGSGHTPSRLALVDISTQSALGFNVSSAISSSLADSGGSAVGSESLGSGIVVRPNEMVCLTFSGPGDIFGHAQGFLTADR